MPGKAKAALFGALIGAVIAVVIEAMAVAFNNEAFFGSDQSWLILVIAVAVVAWSQIRAYDQKTGLYAERDDADDPT